MTERSITRENCQSVRWCLERAAALDAKADGVVQGLDIFENDIGIGFGDRCSEHQAAVDLIAALLELTQHMAANIKGGFALPPTPTGAPTTRAITAMRRVVATAKPRMVDPPRPAKPKPKPDGRKRSENNGRNQVLAEARALGLLSTADMLDALSMTKGGMHKAREQGRVPAPHGYRRGMPFWTREQLAACTTRGKRDPVTTQPARVHQEVVPRAARLAAEAAGAVFVKPRSR